MSYYPIFVDLRGQKVLVVGGGSVARRKITTLLEYGARVSVIARALNPGLDEYVKKGEVTYIGQLFRTDFLEDVFLVIAATDDPELNRRVSRAARRRGLLVNAVDQPADCNFIVPSILRRGSLIIAVSTSGKSPAMAKKVREDLEAVFGPEYSLFLTLMGNLRDLILARGLAGDENKRLFENLIHSPLLKCLGEGQWDRAASLLKDILEISLSGEEVRTMASSEFSPVSLKKSPGVKEKE